MRRSLVLLASVLLVQVCAAGEWCDVTPFFTRQLGGPTPEDAIVSEIDSATQSIYVAMYSLTYEEPGNTRIVDALIRAHSAPRGVSVVVLLDGKQAAGQRQGATELARNGILVMEEAGRGDFHHKFAIMDLQTVITGSYNWSAQAASDNFENIVIIRCAAIARSYYETFTRVQTEYLWAIVPAERSATACEGAAYVGNGTSRVFHRPTCSSVEDMAEHNKVCFASRQDAVYAGYEPCERCNP